MSDSEDLVEMPEDGLDDGPDDLFGDSDGGEAPPAGSDKDLASDDEDGERRRGGYDDEDTQHAVAMQERVIADVDVQRHRTPSSRDGMLHSMRVPKFLRIIPETYDRDSFEPTEDDIENARSENSKMEVRSRKDAATGGFQSNALIHRWSDGSVTVSVGDEHFEIQRKSLAPPADKPYQELQDGHYYAASVNLSTNHYMMVGHVGEQYTVRPGKAVEDDALAKLAERMQAAARGVHEGDMIIRTVKDPEEMKRQAEQAEKDRLKAQRRRETQAAKMDGSQRFRADRGAGLSIGDLEGGRSRKRGAPGSKPKRRRPEYDSDDDLPSGARRAGDDYDVGDDFIAPSDDEEEILDDDDEEEEEEEEPAPRRKRQRTVDPDDDEDADGDMDDGGVGHGRSRQRRQVIDDDDDDED